MKRYGIEVDRGIAMRYATLDEMHAMKFGAPELREMGRKFSEWVEHNSELLATYDPAMPDLHNDRAEDNWRLMIGIADLVGGSWPHRARAAAVHLSRGAEPEVSEPEALLHDIREVWDGNPPKIRSTDLATCLRDMEGRPWSTLNLDRMAKLLKNFPDGRGGMIKPKQLRFGPAGGIHGYKASQFANAFARYPKPVAGVAGVAVETTWPSLDEIAAAVEAVRAELASKKSPPDEEIATPVTPSPMPPTPPAPTAVEAATSPLRADAGGTSAEPSAGATGATGATPAEPVAPEPVVEPKPSGVTPEMHEAIMKRMAEEQAQAEPPTEEDAPVITPAMDVEFMEQVSPEDAAIVARPLHPRLGERWLFAIAEDSKVVRIESPHAVKWYGSIFDAHRRFPQGAWVKGLRFTTLEAALGWRSVGEPTPEPVKPSYPQGEPAEAPNPIVEPVQAEPAAPEPPTVEPEPAPEAAAPVEPVPVEPPTKKNPRGRPPGRPLHAKIGDFWLYARDADGMIVASYNPAAVRWFTRCFHQTEEKPEGDWWPEGPGHSTFAAAKNSIG